MRVGGSGPCAACAAAYYYLDKCELAAAGHAQHALALYEEKNMEDQNALNNILAIFILCRDYADHPYVISDPGFTNGYPDGYDVVDVIVKRPGSSSGSDDEEP